MSKAPLLIDRTSLARRRARTKAGRGYFLHQEAITDLQDRLQMITKPFTDITIVTGHPAPWAEAFPTAQVVPDDEVLNLLPASNDLVIHAMSLHWANDPLGQMIQCRRALRPDGLFLASLLGGKTLNELRSAMSEAETSWMIFAQWVKQMHNWRDHANSPPATCFKRPKKFTVPVSVCPMADCLPHMNKYVLLDGRQMTAIPNLCGPVLPKCDWQRR